MVFRRGVYRHRTAVVWDGWGPSRGTMRSISCRLSRKQAPKCPHVHRSWRGDLVAAGRPTTKNFFANSRPQPWEADLSVGAERRLRFATEVPRDPVSSLQPLPLSAVRTRVRSCASRSMPVSGSRCFSFCLSLTYVLGIFLRRNRSLIASSSVVSLRWCWCAAAWTLMIRQGASSSDRRPPPCSWLPPEKQYLITRNVPCYRRVRDIDQALNSRVGR